MKTTQTETIEAIITTLPAQAEPFLIRGDPEVLADYATVLQEQDARAPRSTVAQTAVQAAVASPTVKPEYLSLADLDSREIARMSLVALKYDLRTFGRNREYRRFKERVAAERDLAMDMQLGLVQQVHCRLHERLLEKSSGQV